MISRNKGKLLETIELLGWKNVRLIIIYAGLAIKLNILYLLATDLMTLDLNKMLQILWRNFLCGGEIEVSKF